MSGSKKRILVIALGVTAVAGLAMAQSQSGTSQQPPFAFRTTTQLVEVNAIAVDSHGNPVPNLAIGDFKLTDNGKPQTISVFSVETNAAGAATAPPQPLPRGTFSNRSQQAGRNVTVILIDDTNQDTLEENASGTTPIASLSLAISEDLAYAKQEVRKFFREMSPQDDVALYAADSRHALRVLHDFTNDSRALISALDGYVPPPVPPAFIPSVTFAPGDQTVDQFSMDSQQEYNLRTRLDRTVAMFQAITEHLTAVPGRKALVWVTAAFPTGLLLSYDESETLGTSTTGIETANPSGLAVDPGTVWPSAMRPLLERMARAFNNANLAIYPVDVRGLLPPSAYAPGQQARPDLSSVGLPEGEDEIATMQDIADRTGGRAFCRTNDFTGAIRQAADEGRVTYTLGYYPTETKWDGAFHTVRLKAARPGVTLRYRKGYFALPPEQLDPTGRQKALMAAALSPLDATSVEVTVQATRRGLKDSAEAELELAIDPRNLSFENSNGRWNAEIELAVVELNAEGDTLKAYDQTRTMTLRPETYGTVEKEGIHFPLRFKILPETERVRVVVRDNPSGALGSVNLPLSQLPAS